MAVMLTFGVRLISSSLPNFGKLGQSTKLPSVCTVACKKFQRYAKFKIDDDGSYMAEVATKYTLE
jgi:hypothetical protein